MKSIIFSVVMTLALFSCTAPGTGKAIPDIRGKWTNTSTAGGKNYEFVANFRDNGTYDGILNGKVLVSGGHFAVSGDTIRFRDAICDSSYIGTYRLRFYDDSVRFSLLSDTCRMRREGTDGFGFKKQ